MSKTKLENGQEAPNIFEEDNFKSRRTTGHNLLDPEGLLSGAEIEAGLGYNTPRVWPDYYTYLDACEGLITTEEILAIAPRKKFVNI